MNRTTLFVLAGLVLLLGLAAWRQLAGEERDRRSNDVLLFEGVDPTRVVRMHVENLARDQHLVFERDERGRWKMIEPMSILADQTIVGHLFQTALDRRGTPVPEAEARAEDLGLDPPRILLEMEEDLGGTTRRTRVDLGAVDIDGQHLNVRAGGRLLRTWRDIDTTLDRRLEDFLNHNVVDLPPQEVVEIHRRGSLVRAEGAVASDLLFDALLEDGMWRVTAPVSAPLEPQGAALFVRGVTMLNIESYVDFGRRLLADYGLDPPEVSIALATVSNRACTLRFGRPGHSPGAEWHAAIEGQPYVWLVDGHTVELLAAPIEEFFDRAVTRIPVGEADGLSLELDGRELRLWRDRAREVAKPVWMVSERPGREGAFTPGVEADRSKVEDLLGSIARAEIASFLPGEQLASDEIRGKIVVQAGELQQGGRFGAEIGSAAGGKGVRYQRTGDTIAGVVDPALVSVLATPARELWSLVVVEVTELEQKELVLTRGETQRRYVRSSKGLWTPPEVAIEARELHDVLDGLMIVRATKHLDADAGRKLADPIEVEMTSIAGGKVRYRIGMVEGEGDVLEVEGRAAVLQDQDLHERLARVLEKD